MNLRFRNYINLTSNLISLKSDSSNFVLWLPLKMRTAGVGVVGRGQ